jgi:hypothetical protein
MKPPVERVLTKLGVVDLLDSDACFRDRLSALRRAAATL